MVRETIIPPHPASSAHPILPATTNPFQQSCIRLKKHHRPASNSRKGTSRSWRKKSPQSAHVGLQLFPQLRRLSCPCNQKSTARSWARRRQVYRGASKVYHGAEEGKFNRDERKFNRDESRPAALAPPSPMLRSRSDTRGPNPKGGHTYGTGADEKGGREGEGMRSEQGALGPCCCASGGRAAAAREGWGFYKLCGRAVREKRSAAVISLHLQNIIKTITFLGLFLFQAILQSLAADRHPAAALCRRVTNHLQSILLLPPSPGEPHSSTPLKLQPRPSQHPYS